MSPYLFPLASPSLPLSLRGWGFDDCSGSGDMDPVGEQLGLKPLQNQNLKGLPF